MKHYENTGLIKSAIEMAHSNTSDYDNNVFPISPRDVGFSLILEET